MRKCGCVYATAKNTASVRSGHELGGYLKIECEEHKARRLASKETAMADVPKLLPCPFCGAEGEENLELCANLVQCLECGARGPAQDGPEILCDPRIARTEWNKRALLSERERRTAQGVTVPEGWALVPIEPTDEMIEASWRATVDACPERRMLNAFRSPKDHHAIKAIDRYAAMLSAAPSLSTSAGGGE
jgi:hypothetical protein